MSKIINHRKHNDEYQFEIQPVDKKGKTSWKTEKDIKPKSLITDYWKKLNQEAGMEHQKQYQFSSYIPQPKKILGTIDDEEDTYLLCEFENFSNPVKVPLRFLQNNCPDMLIEYFEDQVLAHVKEDPNDEDYKGNG